MSQRKKSGKSTGRSPRNERAAPRQEAKGSAPSSLLRQFLRSSPQSHLLLSLATTLLIVEMIVASRAHLRLWPFILCIVFYLFFVLYTLTRSLEMSLRLSRILTVVSLVKMLAVFVGVTGGPSSPYLGIFYLPIFLSCLYYGLRGGLLSTGAVCLYLYLLSFWEIEGPDHAAFTKPFLIQACVFALVSVSASLFAERLRRDTQAATRRAVTQASLVKQSEWFTDTSVMLQSLNNLDVMLSVALMRIESLIRLDSVAIYLRDADDVSLTLERTNATLDRHGSLKSIPLVRLSALRSPEFEALFVPDTSSPPPMFSHFARFDASAKSAIIAPLKTFDDLFGAICIGATEANAFTQKDCDNLAQMARHIVYPIQRVRLETMAATDILTGLKNNRAFRGRLRDEVLRAQRYRHPLSLVLIDVDNFKRVNDSLGHRAGDAILAQVGAILRRCSRGIDYPARYGGEELVILCPESTADDARKLAERIRTMVKDTNFLLPDGGATSITVSAGVSMLAESVSSDIALIEAADQALYRAKAGGRNRVA